MTLQYASTTTDRPVDTLRIDQYTRCKRGVRGTYCVGSRAVQNAHCLHAVTRTISSQTCKASASFRHSWATKKKYSNKDSLNHNFSHVSQTTKHAHCSSTAGILNQYERTLALPDTAFKRGSYCTHSGNQSLISCSADSVESEPWHTLRPTLASNDIQAHDQDTKRHRNKCERRP